jgi:hypothetical protein
MHASPQGTQRRPKPIFRFSVAYFLGVLVLNILISPFLDRLRSGSLIETMLITLVLLFAILSIAGGQRALVGIVLVAPAALGEWLNFWRPEMLIYLMTRGAGLLFIGFVVVQLLRFIVYAPRVDSEVLCAAVAAYLLSGLAWSLAYALLGRLDPNSFVFTLGPKSGQSMNGFTGLYFSFITLSTVGYHPSVGCGADAGHSGGDVWYVLCDAADRSTGLTLLLQKSARSRKRRENSR